MQPITILAIFCRTRIKRFQLWKALRFTRIVVARLRYSDAC
jgi:hypothetical protein